MHQSHPVHLSLRSSTFTVCFTIYGLNHFIFHCASLFLIYLLILTTLSIYCLIFAHVVNVKGAFVIILQDKVILFI